MNLQGDRQNLRVVLQISGLSFVGANAGVFKRLRDGEKRLVISENVAERAARREIEIRFRHGFISQNRFQKRDVRRFVLADL